MRALLVALVVFAGPALAQDKTADAAPQPPAQTAPPAPMLSPVPPARTAAQCRMDCAQTYYFCLSQNEAQDCAPQWSQCRLRCNASEH